MTASFTITFDGRQDLYDAFYNKYGQGRNRDPRWTFTDPKTLTANFKF
jgi:cytochrome oxidase Cu insertion factor (SCO1/SenC/PrrC family)